ncbi:hypothetical protein N7493_005394 [Penicillium malachiteum]|uniref:Uncharacterized protein n=1 Tax=Penicillium malachiteum TaxID=1324776 RepID=A0AAD6MWI4_9EURO|nr:hypothetical protein N7493_005394 [Penicillium malachiteum]
MPEMEFGNNAGAFCKPGAWAMMLYFLMHLIAVWFIFYPILHLRRQMAAIEAATIEAAAIEAGISDLEVDFEVLKEYYFGSNDPVGNPPSKGPLLPIAAMPDKK